MKIRNKKTGEIREVSVNELNQYGLGGQNNKLVKYQKKGEVKRSYNVLTRENIPGDALTSTVKREIVAAYPHYKNMETGFLKGVAYVSPDYKSQEDRELLFKRHRPVAYPSISGAISDYFKDKSNKLFNTSMQQPFKDKEGDYEASEEAWRMTLGLPVKTKYIIPSKYRPLNETNKASKYYTLREDMYNKDLLRKKIQELNLKPGQSAFLPSFAPFVNESYMNQKEFSDVDPLQNFKIGVNKNGKMYFYDKYDFDFEPLSKVTRPYEYEFYNEFKSGGQHGGLDRWFAEKWVDIKTGKPCGRQEGEDRNYPACRPSKRISSATPKTASELSSSEKQKFKQEKTSSQRISYNHKRMEYGGENINNMNYMKSGGNVPTNPELWSRAKSAARSKYDVYPSAYANGFAAKWYKSHGGGWRKAAYGMEVMGNGGVPNNPGFNALPEYVQQNIINNMATGGQKMPPELAYARFAAAGNLDQLNNYGYEQGGSVTLNTGGENHRIYVKTTNRGEGAKGHIMVNHPTMDKGMWDTIDLTEKSGATTIAQGVAATKKWHKENPYKKQEGGGITLPNDFNKFQQFNKTLPENLRDDNFKYGDYSHYDLYGMWDAAGKPNSFDDVKDSENFRLQEDGTYHGFSVGNDGVWLKPKSHPSAFMEYMQGQLNPDPYFLHNHVIQKEDGRLQYVPNNYITKQSLEQKNETDIPQNINPKFMYSAPPSVFANGGDVPMYGPGGQNLPTASDSLALYNNTRELKKFYNNPSKGYKVAYNTPIDKNYFPTQFKNNINTFTKFYNQDKLHDSELLKNSPKVFINNYLKAGYSPSEIQQAVYNLKNDKSGVYNDGNTFKVRDNISTAINWLAPYNIVDRRITPKREVYYSSRTDPGAATTLYEYDEIAVKPAAMKTAADWAYMKKTYGTKPPVKNSNTVNRQITTTAKPPVRQTVNTTQGKVTGVVKPNQIKGSQLVMMMDPVRTKDNLERLEMVAPTLVNPKIVTRGELLPVPSKQTVNLTNLIQPRTYPIDIYDRKGNFIRQEFMGDSEGVVDQNYIGEHHYAPRGGNSYIDTNYAEGGGIPERYRNMGFTSVGAKRQSTRPGKKWMVLAKKGDDYKVVHGGYKGMQDFKQHHSEQRKENFWSRMGGRNSSKATDPFSPLYWHKRFGTWEQGGQIPMAQDGVIVKKYIQQTPYPNYIPEGNIYQMPVMDNLIYEKPVYTKPIIIKNNKSSDKPQVTNNSDNYTKASKYLSRDVLKGATLKASDIANAIEKFKKKTGYNYPLDLLLTQAQQETHFGRELKSKHNYFNVGNDDDGNVINFASPEESLLNYMDLVYNDYLQKGKKDYHDLLVDKAYVNYAGKRYAKDPLYEKKLRDQSQFINRFLNKNKKGGQYMAIGGQNMMNPVVKKDNRNWLEYLKN